MSHPTQTTPEILPRFLRMEQAVSYAGLSRSTLYREMAAGRIAAKKIRGCLLLDRSSLDCFLDEAPDAEIRCSPSPVPAGSPAAAAATK